MSYRTPVTDDFYALPSRVDDELVFLYVGEEKVEIQKFYAEPDQPSEFIRQVAVTGDTTFDPRTIGR